MTLDGSLQQIDAAEAAGYRASLPSRGASSVRARSQLAYLEVRS